MTCIATEAAPIPAGHYSQAVVHAVGDSRLVFVSGQLPVVPGAPMDPEMPIDRQVEQALRNVEAILRAAGSSLDRVLSATLYVVDIARWPEVNAAYARVMGAHRPARTTVPVPALHHGFAVEIQVVAAL
ncbi:MAG TPA: RidA family protein [Phycisphaerales bacterium]|nr:RidA family protein [Phycisphaerales bacterium]HMP38299.1 RidA family protein [Phycisphaerales bacterium]